MVCGVPDLEDSTPYQVAVAPAMSFIASFLYSVLIMDRLQAQRRKWRADVHSSRLCARVRNARARQRNCLQMLRLLRTRDRRRDSLG